MDAHKILRWPGAGHRLGLFGLGIGLLLLGIGVVQTSSGRIDGQVVLKVGESCDELIVNGRNVITATRLMAGEEIANQFAFSPGTADWDEPRRLDLGHQDGVGLRVIKYIRHAAAQTQWVADDNQDDGAVLELRLCGPGGGWVEEGWLAAGLFGNEAVIGPTMYQLWPLAVDTMVEDFLNPPVDPADSLGSLSIHHDARMYRIPVDGNVGCRVPVGDTGIEVELVEYFADARPKLEGGFFSRSNQPRNPLLELRVHFPDRAEPVRQICFAKRPLVNLDGVNGSICPVRFWYHHPCLDRTPGAVFAQAPDGRLWCRAVAEGKYQEPQAVEAGSQVPIGGRLSVLILNHIPQARREVSFVAAEPTDADSASGESAVLVEATFQGHRRNVWLQCDDPQYATQLIQTEAGPLMLSFARQRLPLGYQIRLDELVHEPDPDQPVQMRLASRVQLTDLSTLREEAYSIAPDEPLRYGRFTLHQSGERQRVHGAEATTLQAVHDPGRRLVYLGGLLSLLGGVATIVPRIRWVRRSGDPQDTSSLPLGSEPISHVLLPAHGRPPYKVRETDVASH